MNMKSLFATATLAGAVALLAGGCQMGRHRTPGEQIVMSTAPQPAAAPDTAAAAPDATAPTTPAPTAAPVPAPVERAPVAVIAAPATTAASTAPADRGVRVYVAADADDAARFRNWPPVVNQYSNGNVIAGPVYRITPPPSRSSRWDDTYAVDFFQTGLSIPQMMGTPFWMLGTPPWTAVEYHGEEFPASYTVDDPFPYYENEKVPGMIQMKRDK